MKINKIILISLLLASCAEYHSPKRSDWNQYLYGASFTDMTETSRTAKLPIYMGHGGKIVTASGELSEEDALSLTRKLNIAIDNIPRIRNQ